MEPQKICNNCQTENRSDAKFCASCGTELIREEPMKQCKNCGAENPVTARFCSECGTSLRVQKKDKTRSDQVSRKKSQPRKKSKAKKQEPQKKSYQSWYLLALLIAVAFFYLVSQNSNSQRQTAQPAQYLEQFSSNPAIEKAMQDVAANFVCPCGACGELPLETCTCNTAVQERQFIRSQLSSGQTKEQVIATVKASYGGFKLSQSVQIDPNNLKLDYPITQLNSKPLATDSKISNKLATFADRVEIYSHFSCPCDQCGMPELKDCNCNHVRGATEVKKFVDEKIGEDKYTVSQVVGFVEKKYGHKIR